MVPVEHYVVYEIEYAVPADRWVTARVVCPQVAHKHTVLATQRAAESVVVRIEGFGENAVLYGDVYGTQLLLFRAVVRVEHVTIHRHVLVKTPAGGYVIDHDVAHRVTADGVVATAYVGLTTTEAHIADHNVMGD